MGYILAFLIFLAVVYVIGVIFSFLWPIIAVLIIVALVGNIAAYHKRKKQYEEFYQDSFSQSYQQDTSSSVSNDDIIDVEFSEQEVDDQN